MPVGAWVGSQFSTLKDERFGLLPLMATEKRFIVRADEKLAAFMELEATIRPNLAALGAKTSKAVSPTHHQPEQP